MTNARSSVGAHAKQGPTAGGREPLTDDGRDVVPLGGEAPETSHAEVLVQLQPHRAESTGTSTYPPFDSSAPYRMQANTSASSSWG